MEEKRRQEIRKAILEVAADVTTFNERFSEKMSAATSLHEKVNFHLGVKDGHDPNFVPYKDFFRELSWLKKEYEPVYNSDLIVYDLICGIYDDAHPLDRLEYSD